MDGARIEVNLEGLDRLIRQYPEASDRARISRLTEAMLLLERAVKKLTPVGAGPIHLRDTIFQRVVAGGQSAEGILGTPMQHGMPVEMGTRPHFPPVDPIRHWVERKLGLSGSEAASVAFLIARKISREGTTGVGMFDKGFSENEATVIRILEQIPGDIIREVNA